MSATIKLSAPIMLHGKTIEAITLRAPTAGDLLEIGNPIVTGRTANGSAFESWTDQIVREYIERLADCDPNIFSMIPLKEGLAMAEAVKGFFTQALADLDSSS